MSEYEIQSDGVTVWVHAARGTIARFGVLGIDVHTADTAGCLHCTHGPTTREDWEVFKLKTLEHHGIEVGEEHRPKRFR